MIVDDTDPGIQYTGPWNNGSGQTNSVGNFGPPFQNTTHGVANGGPQIDVLGSVSYTFTSGLDLNSNFFCFCLMTSAQVPESELLEHVRRPI